MKKALCALLALVLMLALLPAASAAYEPVEDTPYGLPLLEKPEDFDLEAVIEGHTLKRLLDLVDNVEVKREMKQVIQKDKHNMLLDDFYFLEDGQYVNYSIQTDLDSKQKVKSYQLFLFDKEDPTYYVKHPGGRDKYQTDPMMVDYLLEGPLYPSSAEYYDLEVTEVKEEENGWITCAFNMTVKPEYIDPDLGDTTTFSDCSITVDPETGLMRAYTFSMKSEGMEQSYNAEVNYNVDQKPDYSLKY